MIVFVYGTTAEAIKLAPVARRLAAQGVGYEQWLTLQQSDTVLRALPGLGLPAPEHVLANGRGGKPLAGPADVLVWLAQIAAWVVRHGWSARRRLRSGGRRSVLVVHGDTMTSVVGALLAKLLGADCAHVEAGLRSGNWRHPFPEELDRRIVGRLADVHYAPSDAATAVLAGRRGVVPTGANTVVDAVLDRAPSARPSDTDPYGLVLLHRFEFLTASGLADRTLAALREHAPHRMVLVADDQARHVLGSRLDALPTELFTVLDKVPHAEFTDLLAGASFAVTDSGGVQEEAALLGVPTLVHRKETERQDGLGENAVLSGWDIDALQHFLQHSAERRRPPQTLRTSPSDIVVKDLMTRDYH
ncbi:UDP-N-acetylglucosamine 2-epimerase [Blastococcus sp. TML/M2B]|uniref:UDP-N-acetylglucosamine 2-epimerase n=1 Tax=unclassified Blastococcus TaxID=2619396 RepID=UPI00190D632E|nr:MULTISPECIES: UDP-N-acetylglucosamine 2-epimerase [unclassified Blastococcus]MBN1093860.1 UDP-N-acetylglucosamine 2-epimerase [Blastococcus sp. TML/M2B]MBN1096017.1 UDP-N-acetylglucosamine 2-epimerase [Blastococcus sp. TML/C7B]